MNPPLRLLTAFQDAFSQQPDCLLSVPGREMWIAACITSSGHMTLSVPDKNARTTFDRRSARLHRTRFNRPLPSWATYLATVALLLPEASLDLPGVDAVIVGEEPAGPRYHHALGMALCTLAHDYHDRDCDEACLMAFMERVQQRLDEHA